jgi:polysaccharide pyruvyl transferase WcaK-like protein
VGNFINYDGQLDTLILKRRQEMKLTILGASLSSGNRGVNALTRGTINALVEKYIDVKITIISYGIDKEVIHSVSTSKGLVEVKEIPCTAKKGIKLFLNVLFFSKISKSVLSKIVNNYLDVYSVLNQSDIVFDISEGDSFSDIYGYKRFMLHSSLKLTAINLNKKLILLPQTMGPFNNKIVKQIAKYIINRSYKSFVRDMISYDVLVNKMGINKQKVIYSPDMAFYMKPDDSYKLSEFARIKSDDIVVGINASALLFNGGYNKKNMFNFKADYKDLIDRIINYFMKIHNVKIILVPHVIIPSMPIEDDLAVSKSIYNKYNKIKSDRIFYIDKQLNEAQLKNIISECDFFIGSRMHACIGAVSTTVPTVPIAYSRKFVGIWRELGLEECVADPREQTIDEILDIVKRNYNSRTNINKILREKVSCLRNNILQMFDYI